MLFEHTIGNEVLPLSWSTSMTACRLRRRLHHHIRLCRISHQRHGGVSIRTKADPAACAQVATEHLQTIATSFEFSRDNYEPLVRTCMTTLSSKMCVSVPRDLPTCRCDLSFVHEPPWPDTASCCGKQATTVRRLLSRDFAAVCCRRGST